MKPTLQEIADMNHSEGVLAMREHYDPTWPMVTHDPDEEVECDMCGDMHPSGVIETDTLHGDICPSCSDQAADWDDE